MRIKNCTYKKKKYIPPIIESYELGDEDGVMQEPHSIQGIVGDSDGNGDNELDLAKEGMMFGFDKFEDFEDSDY